MIALNSFINISRTAASADVSTESDFTFGMPPIRPKIVSIPLVPGSLFCFLTVEFLQLI